VRGDVRLWLYNGQTELLAPGASIFVGAHPRDGERPALPEYSLTIERVRFDSKGALVNFAEVAHREEATLLTHSAWVTPRSQFPPLSDDEFYLTDLIGARGLLFPLESTGDDLETSQPLGELVGLLEAGAGEILVFESEELGEVMVPNLDPFIIEIDLVARVVKVRGIPGLVEGGR
jgi:16S rRNA processing protein RimM